MRKKLKLTEGIFPMPVLMVTTYKCEIKILLLVIDNNFKL